MPEENPISQAAQWFLKDFQRLLEEFAQETKSQVVAIDKEGNLITKLSGVQNVCKLILASEEGRIRCLDSFKMGLSLVKSQKKPIFSDCYAGFASAWVPIIVRESLIGVIIICGGKYDRGESREKLTEKYSKLADELGVVGKENFLKMAVDEVSLVTEEEIRKRAEKLTGLVEILTENVQTPLKEIFG